MQTTLLTLRVPLTPSLEFDPMSIRPVTESDSLVYEFVFELDVTSIRVMELMESNNV